MVMLDSIRALMLIRAYRIRGHLVADLDPLGMRDQTPHPELDPKSYGFTEADMDRPIFIDNVLGLESASMREIEAILKNVQQATAKLPELAETMELTRDVLKDLAADERIRVFSHELNQGKGAGHRWKAIGAAHSDSWAVVWFGKLADPQGPPL